MVTRQLIILGKANNLEEADTSGETEDQEQSKVGGEKDQKVKAKTCNRRKEKNRKGRSNWSGEEV